MKIEKKNTDKWSLMCSKSTLNFSFSNYIWLYNNLLVRFSQFLKINPLSASVALI